jgi:uncharacterized protein YcbX
MEVTHIWIYPVKSLGGIPLETATVMKKGLRYDRRWMLIDADGVAMTQRVHPRMAWFQPEVNGDHIRVGFKGDGEISFNTSTNGLSNRITARVWEDDVIVAEVDPEISKWFTERLGISCRLVAFPEENPRHVDPDYAIGDDHVSLADAYPFLVIGQASLDDLNSRLEQPVSMNRFRPNFVFTGGAPFAEDAWSRVTIGDIPFAAVKKCDRCVMTTVDPETAVKGTEPLRTLSAYRKVGKKVFFGQNMIALREGTIRVGDPITAG